MRRRKKKRKFLVDVFYTYAYSVVVEAGTGKEAKRLVEKAEADGRFSLYDGFHKTDECEIEVYGEVDNNGPNPWPELEVKEDAR